MRVFGVFLSLNGLLFILCEREKFYYFLFRSLLQLGHRNVSPVVEYVGAGLWYFCGLIEQSTHQPRLYKYFLFNSLLQFGHRNVSFGAGIPDSGLSHFNVPFGAFSGVGIAGSGLLRLYESITQLIHKPLVNKYSLLNSLLQFAHTNVSFLVTVGWGLGRERMMSTAINPARIARIRYPNIFTELPSIRSPNSPCESAAAKTAFSQMSRS